MPRFFVGADQLVDGTASVLGQDAEHLARSLRAQIGQLVVVVDESGVEHGRGSPEGPPPHLVALEGAGWEGTGLRAAGHQRTAGGK